MAYGAAGFFRFTTDAVIEIVVALHHVVAGQHQFDALGMAALDDRIVGADALEQLIGLLLAHDGVEAR